MKEQIEKLIKEFETRANYFDTCDKLLSSNYYGGKASEARFAAEKLRLILEGE